MSVIRQDIEILPANEPKLNKGLHKQIVINSRGEAYHKQNRIIGWKVYETIGVAVVNPRGISKSNKLTVIE